MLISQDLEDAEVQEGNSAVFCCRISPANYAPVHWFLDKTPLHTNDLNELEVQPGGYHVLTLRQLTLKDSGTVHFEAGDQRTSASLRVIGGCGPCPGAEGATIERGLTTLNTVLDSGCVLASEAQQMELRLWLACTTPLLC